MQLYAYFTTQNEQKTRGKVSRKSTEEHARKYRENSARYDRQKYERYSPRYALENSARDTREGTHTIHSHVRENFEKINQMTPEKISRKFTEWYPRKYHKIHRDKSRTAL